MPERSLLPPNATPLERGLGAVAGDISGVQLPLAELWDPAACPMDILPWLAWALSVDVWNPAWSDGAKRDAVANSIAEHRIKGTRASVEATIARLDSLLEVVEWHEAGGTGVPHTFEIILPLVTAPGVAPGGERATAAFAEALMRDIAQVKPLREHFRVVQQLVTGTLIGVQTALRAATFVRQDTLLTIDTSQPWGDFLQCETGEPLQSEDGQFLEDVA